MNKIKLVDFCDNDGIMEMNVDISNQKGMIISYLQFFRVELDEDCYVKFLGVNWNVNMGEFCYDFMELIYFQI